MSDEPTPPSLRLKPRQPATPPTPTPEAPVSEPVSEPAMESDPLRLRLKPKAPAPESTLADASSGPFATPAPFSSPPIPAPENGNPSPVEPPPPAPIVSVPLPLPPVKPPQISPPKPHHLPTPRGLADPTATLQKNSPPPAIKADKWLAGVVLFVLVLLVAFYGIRYLIKAHPKSSAQAPATAPAAPPTSKPLSAPAPNKPKLVDSPTSAAGKTIAQARDAIAAHDKREKEQGVTSLLEEPSAPTPAKIPASAGLAPGSSTASAIPPAASTEPPPPPSEAFRQFVAGLRVNGVFQGEPARALINGKMRFLGDVLEVNRNIKLYKIDPESKQLIFQDFTGAIVSRHY